MAEQNIFQRAFSAFRKDAVRGSEDSSTKAPLDHTPTYNNSSAPLEKKQQEFLDWQIDVINRDLYTRSVYYDTDRTTLYNDFRAMDNSPEISAALSIIRDECLDADTIIPLCNGNRMTIEELYGMEAKGFEVYSYNPILKRTEKATCERVSYKGKQEVYKIIFEDESFVVATSEHLWLLKGRNKYDKTLMLQKGDQIQPFSQRDQKTFSFFLNLFNFKKRNSFVVNRIEFVGKRKTYDLVNVGHFNNFAIMIGEEGGVFSHNCLVRNERGNILEIYSKNARVKDILKDLFHNRLNVDYNLRLWIRELVKYGDFFLHLHIDGKDKKGVYDVMALPAEEIHRQEGVDGISGNTRFHWDMKNLYFEDWQIAHFRLIEDVRKLPYGRSILDSARKLWKQLQLAEDAMLVYRLLRAADKRVFYIDVGAIDDADVKQYIEQIKTNLKKQPVVDSRNGQINLKYNPSTQEEDFFIPIRGDKSSRIETLPGSSNISEISDIEYLEKKLFAALQVPKPYLNYTESMQGGSMLAQADLRFSRMINSVQEAVVMELRRIANVHLLFMGYEDELDQFTLALTNPSTQQELLNLETWKTRLEVFKEMFSAEVTSPTSYTWAMENVLGFSKEEIKLILKQKKVEKKIFAEIESAVETYKKIGLFYEIDKKFENQNAASATPPVAGTEGEESLTAEPSTEFGAEPTEAPPTEEVPPAPESPLAESRNKLLKRLLTESDSRADAFYDELLGENEDKPTESLLLKNNEIASTKTYKLRESMKGVEEIIEKRKKEREEVQIDETQLDIPSKSLLESNSASNDEMLQKIDKFRKLINKDGKKENGEER